MKEQQLSGLVSPVTGRRVLEKDHVFVGNENNVEAPVPLGEIPIPLCEGNILLGNESNIAEESDKLKEVISKFLALRYELSLIEQNAKFLLQKAHPLLEKAQALDELGGGILQVDAEGVASIAKLDAATFPDPTGLLTNIPIPNPDWNPLSPWDWLMSGPILGQIFAASSDPTGTTWETGPSSTLALSKAKIAQLLKRFDISGFVLKSRNVNYNWPNPAMALIPPALKSLYGLEDSYSFSNAQALDEIGEGILKNSQSGELSKAVSGEDYVNTTNVPVGRLVIIDPLYPMYGKKLISPTDFSTRGNEPGEFGNLIANVITILTGIAGKFEQFAITSLSDGQLIKSINNGELKSAIPDTDYVQPSTFQVLVTTVSTISSLLSALQIAYDLFVAATTAKDIAQDTAIAANTAKDLVQDVEIITAQTTATGAATLATAAGATAAAAEVTATGAATTAAGASAAAAAAGIAILALQVEMLTKASMGDVTSSVNSAINALTLNGINVTNNIDIKGFKIENLGTPLQPSDAATKAYVDFAVAGIPAPLLTLIGDISGFGYIGFPITTIFNKTLNQILNAGDVNIAGFNLKNLNKTPEDYDDATSFDFLCNLLQDEVGVQWL